MVEPVSIERIAEAADVIDPVFLHSPQYECEPLSAGLGVATVLKVECLNPIRSFKGRGTDYLMHRIEAPTRGLVCASAGNFGQGMAYAARKRGHRVTVFAAVNASPIKVERMRGLGAEVVLEGADFDAAKEAARAYAAAIDALFVEDGALAPIAEGAGTIAVELTKMDDPLDAILVPLGDGALVTGIAAWMRRASPSTRIIGVVAEGAPAMELSWRAAKLVATESIATIADGIAVRVPVASAVEDVRNSVDDVMHVSDEEMIEGMRALLRHAGLVVEPAGAAGIAAAKKLNGQLAGKRVAVIVTGGNITTEQFLKLTG
ncbi:MAG TPA: pyridoxal-phosphate dependent enzyme [Candidatus Dormibacteraeota bacterium]|nr:pyridoxal-phosphate dependent enzyme [Candidatus Dormibacteraeota bacterium]